MGDCEPGYAVPHEKKYRPLEVGFNRDTPDALIEAWFEDMYGHKPEYIRRDGGGAFAGPKPKEESDGN